MEDTYEHSSIETNGIRLHVVTARRPSTRPVILLHGFPEFWYGWRHQIPNLVSAGFHVIVPDQRGYNLSDKPAGVNAYRIHELENDILGLLDHYGFEQRAIAGHDWGAAVAWELAINHPERVSRLVILNVPHPAVMLDFLRRSAKQVFKSWYAGFFQIPALPEGLLRLNHYAGMRRSLLSSGQRWTFTQADLLEYQKAWSQPGALTGMINWYRAALRERNFMGMARRVRVPTLILWGKRDIALSAEMAPASMQLCDQGQLIFFENSSHWVQHDEAEAVNSHMLEFLQEK